MAGGDPGGIPEDCYSSDLNGTPCGCGLSGPGPPERSAPPLRAFVVAVRGRGTSGAAANPLNGMLCASGQPSNCGVQPFADVRPSKTPVPPGDSTTSGSAYCRRPAQAGGPFRWTSRLPDHIGADLVTAHVAVGGAFNGQQVRFKPFITGLGHRAVKSRRTPNGMPSAGNPTHIGAACDYQELIAPSIASRYRFSPASSQPGRMFMHSPLAGGRPLLPRCSADGGGTVGVTASLASSAQAGRHSGPAIARCQRWA